jgi:hypothetical protein
MSVRGRRVALLVVVAVLGALAFAGTPAQAGQARLFSDSFGSATSSVPDPYPLSSSSSVAVDASAGPSRGDVYVADFEGHRVEKFDSSGHLILMFGEAVNKTKVEEGRPEAEQNVCLASETCQRGTAAATPGAFQGQLFVAVDSSAGSSAGDVYVADGYGGGSQVTKFDENGHVVYLWASAGQLGGASIPEGAFVEIKGIAVDSSGNLWVIEANHHPNSQGSILRAFEFTSNASLITSWQAPLGSLTENTPAQLSGLALDSSDHLYLIEEDGDTAEWSSSGSKVGTITSRLVDPDTGEPNTITQRQFEPFALALDPASEDVYQAGPFPAFAPFDTSSLVIRRFAAASCKPSGEEHLCGAAESFALGRIPDGAYSISLTVDPTTPADTLYAAYTGYTEGPEFEHYGEVAGFATETVPDVITVKASSFAGASTRLNGTVNPSGVPLTKCVFEWGEREGSYEHEAPCEAPDATGLGSGSSPVEAHAKISGLTAGKTYHFRLVASNANTDLAEEPSRGEDLAFGPPRVLGTSALAVSATSATLQSELNPVNVQTRYHFEYDTTPYGEGEASHGFSVPLPDASAGSGGATVTGSALVGGLAPATVYHYRVVATNTLGSVAGPDGSFTTQSAIYGPASLDGRVWEMVSPLQKSGSRIYGIGDGLEGVLQASADGDGLAFVANGPFGQEAPSNRSLANSQFLASRGANGWSTKDVTTPREDVVGFLPANLSGYRAFSQDLSLGAVQPRGFTPLSPLATETTPYLRVASGEFVPLVDPLNVPPETVFDSKVDSLDQIINREPKIEGGSSDLHSVVIASCFKLTEDAVNSCGKNVRSLFVWHEGVLRLASVLPNDHPAALAGGGSSLGGDVLKRNAISEDGTRLVFTTTAAGSHLYLRDLALAKTVQLDLPEPGIAGEGGNPLFEDMSADGSKVFFTDSARLTTGSDADNAHRDLYMCGIVVQGEALTCALKDLSVAGNAGEAGAVLGPSLGGASSGRFVYFVANGALTPGAAPGDCTVSGGVGTGICGLYLYDTVAGTVKLVTILSGADHTDWGGQRCSSTEGNDGSCVSQWSVFGFYVAA